MVIFTIKGGVVLNRKIFIGVFFLIIMLLSACSNVKETLYNSETKDIVSKTDELTKEEKDFFQSAVTYAKDNDVDLEGKEVSKIIADEQVRLEKVRKEEEERKKELQRQKEKKEQELKNSIQITLDGKSVIPKNKDRWQFSDIINFDFTFENTTNKDMKGFKGVAIFNDLFGDNIKKVNVSYDKIIGANNKTNWQGAIEVNQFMNEDIKLRDMEFTKIQFEFDMDTIIFSDGTTLTKYGENTQATNTETKDNPKQNTQNDKEDTQTKDTKDAQQSKKNTIDPYEWATGLKETFENKMIDLGYIDSKDNIIYKKYQINDKQEGMYEVYTKVDGKEVYVVVVNVKTGEFHG